jgi:heme/copper-type cytochrome/quinol oxidase subunit 3
MSFREKIHWVAFISLTAAFGWYFLAYPWAMIDRPEGVGAAAGMLLPVTIVIIGSMSLVAAALAIRTPQEAHLREDEREKTIHLKGTHAAYYPLVLGVWANLFAIFYHISAAGRLNLLIATVVVAELVRVGAQLYYYRRGY